MQSCTVEFGVNFLFPESEVALGDGSFVRLDVNMELNTRELGEWPFD